MVLVALVVLVSSCWWRLLVVLLVLVVLPQEGGSHVWRSHQSSDFDAFCGGVVGGCGGTIGSVSGFGGCFVGGVVLNSCFCWWW